MITIKNKVAIEKMYYAGQKLAEIFFEVSSIIKTGVTTLDIDRWIEQKLKENRLVSQSMGYKGYRHVSCISVNDVVVHGIPSAKIILQQGDLVKVDVCAAWRDYCADMARCFFVDTVDEKTDKLIKVTEESLNNGIAKAITGKRLSDISAAIQETVESNGYGVVRDFAGHGIGKSMHEDPEVLNYGKPGYGPLLRAGMTFAIEPMVTMGNYEVYVASDGWTVKTKDGSKAAHIEDTIVVTEQGPRILTRLNNATEV